jgi:hypothetical protein
MKIIGITRLIMNLYFLCVLRVLCGEAFKI